MPALPDRRAQLESGSAANTAAQLKRPSRLRKTNISKAAVPPVRLPKQSGQAACDPEHLEGGSAANDANQIVLSNLLLAINYCTCNNTHPTMLCGSRKPIGPEVLLTVGLTRVPGGGLGLQICSQTIRNVSGVFWEANVSRSRYNLSAGALGKIFAREGGRGGGGRAGWNIDIVEAIGGRACESFKHESNGRLQFVLSSLPARASVEQRPHCGKHVGIHRFTIRKSSCNDVCECIVFKPGSLLGLAVAVQS